MSRTYKATGINLKSMPLGEADRLLTILTQEFGLIRAVAPGVRKQNSKIGGRSGLFVVNELLIAQGRSLDKITQAETIESYPALSQDLGKLAASQYLAEMAMCQALSEQPQTELFFLLNEHLKRLEQLPKSAGSSTLAHLCHAAFHLLALAGVAPQVQACSLTANSLIPDFSTPDWQVGFSTSAGGTVNLSAWENATATGKNSDRNKSIKPDVTNTNILPPTGRVAEAMGTAYRAIAHKQEKLVLDRRINAAELTLLQQLSQANLPAIAVLDRHNWLSIERILRQYVQYHFGRPIRSAALIDSYFASLPSPLTEDHATV
ncbi:DNA repair protein RecO [Chroococcidiopsis sp. FACHB-1243]|uniref:DNA repair protein RecO n=1 Tax=Chroococcidiopsis sp. [FACHB-1243] TaxID=2692781 RepID=UPI00177F0D04|nr:DNA repair protein RecO [Chroococcidiopsis sp. [FACHB-1243]]MBD2306185.1 DNA repair protein RecO [Chroococcidiopsis sp. [FACHB-1243]]